MSLDSLLSRMKIIDTAGVNEVAVTGSNALKVDGSATTQPISAASLPLPTGAATAAKQPALGTAGSASADVISVQGVASMTALKVDGSAVTQPVSGTITANAGTNLNTSLLALESGGNLATLAGAVTSSIVQTNIKQMNGVTVTMGNGISGTGVQRVTIASDSTGQIALAAGTAEIGNVKNSGTFAVQAAQSGTWNITNVSGTISLPTGAATAAKQPALGTAGTASSDVITVQGIASMTALKVDGSAVTQPVSGTITATISSSTNAGATAKTSDYDTGAGTDTVTMFGIALPASGGAVAGGTATNPIQVSLANTAANSTAIKVDNSAVTQPISAASLPLPTGAATAAKQPALGTAGSASADVISVQGVASMTALKVDGSGVTQPVSGTVSITANSAINVAQIGGSSTSTVASGVQKVAIADSSAAAFLSAATGLNSTGAGILAAQIVGQFDDVSPTAITENQFGNLRMSTNRNLYGTIRDAAGNERGVNVNASNQLSVSVDNTVTVASHAVTNAGTFAVQAAQSGTWNITNISGTVSLPTGAATAAKQPALGTAGSASADVISVQGVASMTALKVDGSAVTQPISGTVSVTGVATSTKQSDGSQKTQIVDGSGNVIAATSNALNVHLDSGVTVLSGNFTDASDHAEDAAHVSGDIGSFILGVRNDSLGTTFTSTNGDYSPIAVSSTGVVRVDPSGTTAQPITDNSGSITVDNGGTFAVQATLSAETTKVIGVVRTADGSGNLLTSTTNALDVNLKSSGLSNLSSNIAQINGVTPLMGNGTTGTGSLRVTIASDNTAFAVNATLQTGSNAIGKLAANAGVDIGAVEQQGTWTVQPGNTANTTPWLVTPTPASSGGATFFSGSIGATKTVIKSVASQLYGYDLYNPNTSVAYVQFFNVATGSVTLGTTVPDVSIAIPPGAGRNVWLDGGVAFGTAMTIAVTTTRTGSTGPSSTVDYNLWVK